jgi:ADP-ribose pyrophosphatase YjhB (NUDIX family)
MHRALRGGQESLAHYNGFVDTPLDHFAHCPRCAAGQPVPTVRERHAPFRCEACGFTLFFNAASAVAAILVREDGRALFIRRGTDPAQGKLGMPGGFVDPGESAEHALVREIREEVGLEVTALHYLCSHPNRYVYSGVTYTTLDLFFTGSAANPGRAVALDAVESLEWEDPLSIDLEEFAFDSAREALCAYRSRAGHRDRD